jgi:hypothetical protein
VLCVGSTSTDEELSVISHNTGYFPRLDPFQFDWEDDQDCCDCCPCCDVPPTQNNIDDPFHTGVKVCLVHKEENEFHSYKKMRPKSLHVYTDGRSLQAPRNAKDPYYRKAAPKPSSYIQSKRALWSKRLKSMLKQVSPEMFHKCIDCVIGVTVGGKSLFKLNVNRLISFSKSIIGECCFYCDE